MEKLYRQAVIELDRSNGGEVVSASLSSEEPVDRPEFGREILDHSAGSVDLSRTKSGLPLLWQHNPDEIIGRAVDIRLEGRKLRANLKPARNARAQEVWQDIKDGVIRDLSIGYSIDPSSIKRESDGSYRVMRWKVFETSAVSIPADASVGIGRNINLRKENKMNRCQNCGTMIPEGQNCPVCGERQRAKEIRAIAAKFKMVEEGEQFIESGQSAEAFKALIVERFQTREDSLTHPPRVEGISGGQAAKFYPGAGGKVSYRSTFGNPIIDSDFQSLGDFALTVMNRPYDPRLQKRTQTSGVGASGGFTVPEQIEETLFDNGLEDSELFQRVRFFPMNTDILKIPAPDLSSHAAGIYGLTAEWVGEGVTPAEQNLRLRQIELNLNPA